MIHAEYVDTMTIDLPNRGDELPDTINALALGPGGISFAARNAGLFRSGDGGQSWRAAYASLNLDAPLATTALALSPNFASDQTLLAGANGGVLRSADGGDSWQITMLPEPAPLVTRLALSPNFAADQLAFAGTLEDGMFRSHDGGATWAAWNFGLLDPNVLALAISPDFARDQTLYVGADSGLFRSGNTGRSWGEVELPAGFAAVLSIVAAGAQLWVGTEDAGLLYTADGGRSWRQLADLGGPINELVALGASELLALADDRALVSRDAGASWAELQAGVVALAAGAGAGALAGMADGSVRQLAFQTGL